MIGVFDVIGKLVSFTVEPDIAYHAMLGGISACRKRRMANDGLGIGMAVLRVCEDHALLQQVAESALAEPVTVTVQQITPKAIYGDL